MPTTLIRGKRQDIWRSILTEHPRVLNLVAAFAYLVVMALALRAAGPAGRGRARLHWAGVAACFLGLAAWRLLEGESWIQALARNAAHAAGDYDRRRDWQGPLVAMALLFGAPALAWIAWQARQVPTILWSRLATLGLLAYSALRALSFHPVDALIYAGIGRLHINHGIDLGLCAVVAACALRRPGRVGHRHPRRDGKPVFRSRDKESD